MNKREWDAHRGTTGYCAKCGGHEAEEAAMTTNDPARVAAERILAWEVGRDKPDCPSSIRHVAAIIREAYAAQPIKGGKP